MERPATGPQSAAPLPIPPAPPPDPDAPITRAEFSQVMDALQGLTQQFQVTPEQHAEMMSHRPTGGGLGPETDALESEITPKGKVWKAAKWAATILVGGAVVIFGLGAGYQKAIGDNATKTDVGESMKTHRVEDFEPLQQEVVQFKADMIPVQQGVGTLVDDRNKEQEVKKAKRKLKRYDKEHLAALEVYAADKAAGRRAGSYPTKSSAHINLEDKVEELEDAL